MEHKNLISELITGEFDTPICETRQFEKEGSLKRTEKNFFQSSCFFKKNDV